MREARQAAPDGARASAALSSSESSRFSRGTEPLRREICNAIMSCVFANTIRGQEYKRETTITATPLHSARSLNVRLANQDFIGCVEACEST